MLIAVVLGALAMKASERAPQHTKPMPPIDHNDSAATEPVAVLPVVDQPEETRSRELVVRESDVNLPASRTEEIGGRDLVVHESNENPPGSIAPAGYSGRPIIRGLTAITLRPRVSVLSGTVPLAVHVTMLECGWTGPTVGNPYEDLEFTVNFGDAAGTQRFTNPVDETTVNPNSDQVGPEALYVYHTPGTYTITVTARGWNGTQFISATSTTVVQGASVMTRTIGATTGTYTLRVQNATHARSARWTVSKSALVRPAGHAIVPSASGFLFAGWFKVGNGVSTLTMTLAGTYSDAPALGAGKSWRLWYAGATGKLNLDVGNPGTTTQTTLASTETGLGVGWHHVAAWCDTTGTLGIAIDGGTPATIARTANPMTIPSNVPFALSGYTSSSNAVTQTFLGNMDEIAFWNRPPREGEIAWLYNGGAGRHYGDLAVGVPPSSLPTGLVAWWSLDEPYGPSWADATGNGHTLQEGLVQASGTKPAFAVMGDLARVYQPGGVETAPIAFDAGIAEVASAVAAALGVNAPSLDPTAPGLDTAWDVYRDGNFSLRFGGTTAGQPWTLAPGRIAGGFDGTLQVLGESDGDTAPGVTARPWDVANYPEIYFDSNAPAGGTGTAVAPYKDVAVLRTTLGEYGGGKRIRIAAGSDFLIGEGTASGITLAPVAPILIQKWGSGADPILRNTSTKNMFSLKMKNDEASAGLIIDSVTLKSDHGVLISVNTTPTTTTNLRRENVYLINCTIDNTSFDTVVMTLAGQEVDRVGVYGGSLYGGLPTGLGGKPSNFAFNTSAFAAVVGTSISGGGMTPGHNGSIYCHHIYWTSQGCATFGRWIRFGLSANDPATGIPGELNFCIKGTSYGHLLDATYGDPVLRRGFVLDSSRLTGTSNACGFGRHNGNEAIGNAYVHMVISNNVMYYTPPVVRQGLGPYFPDVYTVALRDNRIWGLSGITVKPSYPEYATQSAIYRNKVHGNTDVIGNPGLIFFKDAGRAYITDNAVINAAPGAGARGVIATVWATTAAQGDAIEIDRNQYYAPNWPNDAIIRDDTNPAVMKTMTQWRALGYDINSVVGDAGWRSPSTGDFSTSGEVTTTYSLTGPRSVLVGDTQVFTLTPSNPVSGVVVSLSLTSSTGQTTTKVVTLSGANSVTFQHAAASPGTVTMTATNGGGLVDPTPLVVNVMPRRRHQMPRITPQQLDRARVATRRRAGR